MYLNGSINDSPTIEEIAGAVITSGGGLFVKYDGNGKAILTVDGDLAVGVLPIDASEAIAIGDRVTVIVKEIVLVKAGAAVAKGAEVASSATGKAITAVATKYVNGIALTASTAADQFIQVQLVRAGVK